MYSYSLDGHQLQRCDQISDLLVIVDSKLTFSHHVDEVVSKANRMLGLLTRAPLGGAETAPPSTFPRIAQKRKGVGLQNFREPLPTSILHMLTKGKFRTYDRSAVSDVRVTSCSAILGQK